MSQPRASSGQITSPRERRLDQDRSSIFHKPCLPNWMHTSRICPQQSYLWSFCYEQAGGESQTYCISRVIPVWSKRTRNGRWSVTSKLRGIQLIQYNSEK